MPSLEVADTMCMKPVRIPFRSAGVRRDDAPGTPFRDVFPDPLEHGRLGVQVVDGDVEETLDLRGVQVHRDDVVRACNDTLNSDLEHTEH